jgi:hypothetical protein
MNTFLAIFYSFNLAFSPIYYYGDIQAKNANTITSEFGVDLFEHCKVYGGFSSVQKPITWYNYQPMNQKYTVGIEGHFDLNKQTHINVGVKHICSHPVKAWDYETSDFNEAQTTIYMGISGTIPILLH